MVNTAIGYLLQDKRQFIPCIFSGVCDLIFLFGTDIRAIAPTCLHVGGVQGSIEDEGKLTEIFGRFGTVLAVTLRIRRDGKKVSWALVSFSSVSEADSCLSGMAELAKQYPGLAARQVDESQVGTASCFVSIACSACWLAIDH